jgi:aspartate aminotransferase
LDFSAGDPDFPTPDPICRAVKTAVDDGYTHYSPSSGILELRTAIADKLQSENGIPATPDDITVTPGAKQAIAEAIIALVEPGDEVVVPTPAWTSYEPLVRLAGGTVRPVPLAPDDGFSLPKAELAAAVDDDTKLVLLNTPSNPTGTVFSRDGIECLRDLAVDHDVWVISDEIYEKLVYSGTHYSIGAMDGMERRTVTVNGFSKSHAMTGWRLGYYMAPQALRQQTAKVHAHTVTSATSFVQRAGIRALEADDSLIQPMIDTFSRRRELVIDEFHSHGIDLPSPDGAFYAFVPLPSDLSSTETCETLLDQHHVATVPGDAFGADKYLRMAYTTDCETIREGVARIAAFLSEAR